MRPSTVTPLVEAARARLATLPMDDLARAGFRRDRASYFLNISYPSLQAMNELVRGDSLFHGSVLQGRPLGPAALYVHVPFCTALCYYCHYYKEYGRPPEAVDAFLASVEQELQLLEQRFGVLTAASLYVGGGTPSYLTPLQIETLFSTLRRYVNLPDGIEITFEVHPESSEGDRLQVLREVGVTRINLGIESFDDRVLSLENRRHTVAEALEAVARVEDLRFMSYNLDLIYGLRDQGLHQWEETLDRLRDVAPPSATLYYLRLKRKTPETAAFRREPHRFPSEADLLLMHVMNFERMEIDLGYIQRPVDWFIKSEAYFHAYQDHNWARTDETPLIGVGPSAYSYVGGWQYYNVNDLTSYSRLVGAGMLPWWRGEFLTGDEPMRRTIMLGIKNRIDRTWFRKLYGIDPVEAFPAEFAMLRGAELVETNIDAIELTYTGRLLADEVGRLFYSDSIKRRMSDIDSDMISTTWPTLNRRGALSVDTSDAPIAHASPDRL